MKKKDENTGWYVKKKCQILYRYFYNFDERYRYLVSKCTKNHNINSTVYRTGLLYLKFGANYHCKRTVALQILCSFKSRTCKSGYKQKFYRAEKETGKIRTLMSRQTQRSLAVFCASDQCFFTKSATIRRRAIMTAPVRVN